MCVSNLTLLEIMYISLYRQGKWKLQLIVKLMQISFPSDYYLYIKQENDHLNRN